MNTTTVQTVKESVSHIFTHKVEQLRFAYVLERAAIAVHPLMRSLAHAEDHDHSVALYVGGII